MSLKFLAVVVVLSTVAAMDLVEKRNFVTLGCMGKFDNAKFARLTRMCEECYYNFLDHRNIFGECRDNCFKNDIFPQCAETLMVHINEPHVLNYVDDLYGSK